MRMAVILHALLLLIMLGCGEKADPVSEDGEKQQEHDITYTEHISPILEENCTSCHSTEKQGAERNGASLNVDFNTYEDSSKSASRANARIQAGTMPPSGALSEEDMNLFDQWVESGKPE